MIAPPRAVRFEYRGWLVEVVVFRNGAKFGGHAALKADGKHKCTMTLVNSRESEREARAALEAKSKALIDEWAY